jgi:DUF4097 and DUF4098 domain-containing protein YvlB
LAGPVVLIILGILFLLGNMGVLHWSMLRHWFANYWPLLIIVWGVIKLVEYQQAQREGERPRAIGAGGVFLLIVLIVFGLAAKQAETVNWSGIRDSIDIDDDNFALFGTSYSYDDSLKQDFPAGANLHVVDDRGAVTVNTAENSNQIEVAVHKRVVADNQQDADKWNGQTKPTISTSGNTVTLNANTQGAGDHAIAADLTITIPRKASVIISTRRGDVSVTNREGDIDVSNQHGDVNVSDITGKVTLSLQHTSARVSQITGDVTVEGRVDDISVEDIHGEVRLNGEFMESVKVARVTKSVIFKSSRTDLEFAKLDGDLDLDSGDLRATDLFGPARLITRSKDIRLQDVNGDLRVQDENGSVEVRMKKLGEVELTNRKGDVQLYLPEKTGFQLEARTRNGDLQTDFSELQVNNNNDTATASGSAAGGGSRVVINNEHGDIEIRKGSSVASLPEPPAAPGKPPKAPAPPKAPKITEN